MKKNYILIPLGVFMLFAFTKLNNQELYVGKMVKYNLPKANTISTVNKGIVPFEVFFTPTINNSFIGFKEAVAFKESQGKYHKVNTLGYLGKYQFGVSTLNRLKIYNTRDFLNNPELQEDAFLALCSLNKWILIRDIKRSVGKKINGIEITESGILAAAHLSGAGNVKKYLRSNGKIIFSDAYGSDIQHYMKKFKGYDTSFVKPIKNATI
ncbi:MAG: peptidoglycan-binding protein LysM [Flavobacteriaceae bacterium]|nr:peptidoglycan-binding protein LysM [Flavobacteriaceae bacterium]